jgi:hypothetical protein
MQEANILLEKINALQRNINLNKGPMAAIERDLMLSYIRQLYEIYLEDGMPPVQTAVPPQPSKPEAIKPAPKAQVIEPPKPVYTPLKAVDTPKPPAPKEELLVVREVPPPLPVVPAYTPPKPTPTPVPPHGTGANRAKINALFTVQSSNDLSERLSTRPIADLTKAFAINDRLLYVNELFGKDADSFNESLKLLNKFERMEEAKSLLVSLAEQYDWTQDERMEIAQGFVKTVRRKYG